MADLPAAGATSFTRQQAPLGLGHAVWCAREIVGDEPFAVLLPDMVTRGGRARRTLPRPVRRGLREARRQHHRGRRGSAGRNAPIRHRRGRRGPRRDLRDHQDGRKAEAGDGAVQPHHFRALHPPAGDLRDPRAGREGRGRRNPAHRRHDRARPQRSPFTARASTGEPTIAARSSDSSAPTSPSRSTAATLPRAQGGTAPAGLCRSVVIEERCGYPAPRARRRIAGRMRRSVSAARHFQPRRE